MAEQIPEIDLIKGKWYIGRGRNCNVGYWDGSSFLVICEKFDEYIIKREPYYAEDSGCFQPFALVDEGVMVEPFGPLAWDRHYGRRMEFGLESGRPASCLTDSDLTGSWIGSTYLPDGQRIEINLILRSEGTFEERTHAQTGEGMRAHAFRGTWKFQQSERRLQLIDERDDVAVKISWMSILDYSGSTITLRWVALAPRNLPIQYYRVSVASEK